MRITVLTGGTSTERDVAIASAGQVVRALRQRDHLVNVVDIAQGYVTEAEEAALFPDAVGSEPPATEPLRAQERNLLVSGLADVHEVLHGAPRELVAFVTSRTLSCSTT